MESCLSEKHLFWGQLNCLCPEAYVTRQNGTFFFLVPITILSLPFFPPVDRSSFSFVSESALCYERLFSFIRGRSVPVSVCILRTWGGVGGLAGHMPVSTQVPLRQSQNDCGQGLGVGKAEQRLRGRSGREIREAGLGWPGPRYPPNPLSPPSQGGCKCFPHPQWLPVASPSAVRNPSFPLVMDYVFGPSRQQGRTKGGQL